MSKIAENLYTVKKSIEATLRIQFVSIGGKTINTIIVAHNIGTTTKVVR